MAGKNFVISGITMFLIVLFSQYMRNISVPLPKYSMKKKQCTTTSYPIFKGEMK